MTVRLIASDLDGTLFGADHLPARRTVQAVNAAVEAGYVFAAVTGRSYFGGADRVISTGANVHWFIGSNGGHRKNMMTGELEERLIFSEAELQAMLSTLLDAFPGIGFGFEHASGFTYDETFVRTIPESFDGGPRRNSGEWASTDVGKLFIVHPEISNDDLLIGARAAVDPAIQSATSGAAMIELTPAGGNKGLALERLCDQLGIESHEVVAFGDNNNDLEMIRWAGRGIAMANAIPELIEAADEVTDTNINFGVAQVIEALL